jgi:hypothetical protein
MRTMRDTRARGTLAVMTVPSRQDEFRYRDHPKRAANSLLLVAVALLLASFLTGAWALAALLHASWLHVNELPVGDNVSWGVGLLLLATLQGVSALLVLFDRPAGRVLGITVAVIDIASHIGAIRAYPAWSLFAIAVNALIVYMLVAYGRRRGR